MRLVIDLQSAQSGSFYGGIGRYSIALVQSICRKQVDFEVIIVLNSLLPKFINEIRYKLSPYVAQKNIISFFPLSDTKESHADSLRIEVSEQLRKDFIKRLNPDVVLVTSLIEGTNDDVTVSCRLDEPYKKVVILYDLIPLKYKSSYFKNDEQFEIYKSKINQFANADLLLAISEYSKDEGLDVFGNMSPEIINISTGVSSNFVVKTISDDQKNRLRHVYGINEDFILFVGSYDQRKNHNNLIISFGLAKQKYKLNVKLVIVGNGNENIYKKYRAVAANAGLKDDDIVFLGHIPDDDLLLLYNLGKLLVFPSLYEGFGLPVLEAMKCGMPVIATDSTSIAEVVGCNKYLFDPNDVEQIANMIGKVFNDDKFYKEMRLYIDNQCAKFSWDITADRAISSIRNLVSSEYTHYSKKSNYRYDAYYLNSIYKALPNAVTKHEIIKSQNINNYVVKLFESNSFASEKIGVITTWNTKCGIASFTKLLLESSFKDYVIFAPDVNPNELTQPDELYVRRVFSLSDNAYDKLLDAIRKDNISSLLIQFNYGFFDFKTFNDFVDLVIQDGVSVYWEMHSTVDPPVEISTKTLCTLSNSLVKSCGVFVHSLYDINRLASAGVTSNVVLIPLGIKELAFNSPERPVNANKFFTIGTYGFFLPNKGLLEIIKAFNLVVNEGYDIKLLMVNAEYPVPESSKLIEEARDLICKFNISDRVELHNEYLSDIDSLTLLNHADVLVYPYQQSGESASAAVRHGMLINKPIVVTPLDIFKDVWDAVKKFAGTDISDLANGIKDAYKAYHSNDNELADLVKRSVRWKRSNSYRNVSKAIFNTILVNNKIATYPSIRRFTTANGLVTSTGDVIDSSIELKAKPGDVISFGPYVDLFAGCYDVIVDISACKFDINITFENNGVPDNKLIPYEDVENDGFYRARFETLNNLTCFQVVIIIHEVGFCKLNSITIVEVSKYV